MNFLYTPSGMMDFTGVSIQTLTNDDPSLCGAKVTYKKDDESEIYIDICPATILSFTGETSIKDCSTYYVVLNRDGSGFNLVNKFAETFYTKQSGIQYIRSNNINVPMQIYIPFATSNLDEATLRVSGPGTITLDGEPLDESLVIPASQENFTECLWSLVPRVSAPSQSASPVQVQLTLNGQPLRKAGVSIVGKTSDGVIGTSVQTNADGVAEFSAASGSVVEFGFRYYSNMTSTTIL